MRKPQTGTRKGQGARAGRRSFSLWMAPPNPFWVQRYLRDHNLDALLADAVNQVLKLRFLHDSGQSGRERESWRQSESDNYSHLVQPSSPATQHTCSCMHANGVLYMCGDRGRLDRLWSSGQRTPRHHSPSILPCSQNATGKSPRSPLARRSTGVRP